MEEIMEFTINLNYPSMTFEAMSDNIRITQREALVSLLNLDKLELGNLYIEKVMGNIYRVLGKLEAPGFNEGGKAVRFVIPLSDPKCMYSIKLPNTYIEPQFWADDLTTPVSRTFLFCIYTGPVSEEDLVPIFEMLFDQLNENDHYGNKKIYLQNRKTGTAAIMSETSFTPIVLDTEPYLHYEHLTPKVK